MNRKQAKIRCKLSKEEWEALGENGFAKWYEVMEHFGNGGNVEFKTMERAWFIAKSPSFNIDTDFRIKPKTHIVNGFEVPAPIKEYTGPRTVYVPHFWYDDWSAEITGAGVVKRLIERRVAFETAEASRANALAMAGIDPSTYDHEADDNE